MGNQDALKIGTVRSLRKEVWHLTGGSACFLVSSSTAGSALPPKRRVGVFQTPDSMAKMRNDFQNCFHFIATVRFFFFEEFFHGNLDVIFETTFRKPCLLKLCRVFNLKVALIHVLPLLTAL